MNRIEFSDPRGTVIAPEPQAESGLDVRDIIQIVWGARWLLGVCGLVGALIAFVLVKQVTPQYSSSASIMLDTRQTSVIDIESVLSDVPLNRQMLESELLIIESDTLLERVVDKLRLDRDPEYNPRLSQPSPTDLLIARKKEEVTAILNSFIGEFFPGDAQAAQDVEPVPTAPPTPAAIAARAEADRRRAVRILRGRLRARQLAPAFALSVQVTSADPVRAALIANTVADQYVVDQLEAKYSAARRASTWLASRVEELRARVEQKEAAIQAYKNEFRTGDSQASAITRQQIAQVNSELIDAQAEQAQAQAKLDQARQMVSRLGAGGAATALNSPLSLSLRSQQAELKRREAELSNRYGPKHPTMIELRNELRDLEAAISGEVGQIVSSLENDVRVAAARVRTLSSALGNLETKEAGQAEAGVGLRQLEGEAEAARRIYADFLERLNETREQEGFQTADSRVIEPAIPAVAPFVPRSKVTTALGGIAGLAFGMGIVVLLRLLNRSFRTVAQLSEATGLTVYASVPKVSRRRARNILSYLKRRPNSDLAESVRYLRNAILIGDSGKIRSVLITSSFPEEGKSTLSIILSSMLARMGKSVVLVDCDLRRPALARALSIKPNLDLMSLLDSGSVLNRASQDVKLTAIDTPPEADQPVAEPIAGPSVDHVAVTPNGEKFDFIPLRTGHSASVDTLASPAFSNLVEELEERYDVVVIDGPPVLGVSDFSIIGKLVDTSVVVVQWDKTPVAALKRTLQSLANHQMDVIGAVLSKVDRKREAQYDSATYGAEYASFRRYYTN